MSEARGKTEIQCPIDLFEPQEVKIKALTKAMNAAPNAVGKVRYAHELLDEVAVLLTCTSYDGANLNCDLCRSFSELRQRTASLIIKAGTGAAAH